MRLPFTVSLSLAERPRMRTLHACTPSVSSVAASPGFSLDSASVSPEPAVIAKVTTVAPTLRRCTTLSAGQVFAAGTLTVPVAEKARLILFPMCAEVNA